MSLPTGKWTVEPLKVGLNYSIIAGGLQVAVCARKDVAEAICHRMNEAALFDAESYVLGHALRLLERRGVE